MYHSKIYTLTYRLLHRGAIMNKNIVYQDCQGMDQAYTCPPCMQNQSLLFNSAAMSSMPENVEKALIEPVQAGKASSKTIPNGIHNTAWSEQAK